MHYKILALILIVIISIPITVYVWQSHNQADSILINNELPKVVNLLDSFGVNTNDNSKNEKYNSLLNVIEQYDNIMSFENQDNSTLKEGLVKWTDIFLSKNPITNNTTMNHNMYDNDILRISITKEMPYAPNNQRELTEGDIVINLTPQIQGIFNPSLQHIIEDKTVNYPSMFWFDYDESEYFIIGQLTQQEITQLARIIIQ